MNATTETALQLAYDIVGEGDPILFISGTNDTKDGWALNVPAFEGYRCITFDNRDVGESPRVDEPYTVVDMAVDALGLLNDLGVERAHVAGHSMGGMIAQELALLAPDRVRSLVLVGTAAHLDSYSAAAIDTWKRLRPLLSAEDFARAAMFFWCGQTTIKAMGFDALLEFVAPVVAAQEADAFVRQLAAIEARDRRPFLKDIVAPTLVVHGAEDATALPDAARELTDGIPNAHLYLMEGAGHGTLFEQPDAFNAAVREFIGSVA